MYTRPLFVNLLNFGIMRLSRRFKYLFRIFIWGFLGFNIGLLVFLNLPFVQEKLSSIVSKELRNLLQTEVSVGHVDVGLLNRIIVEDILLEDRQGQEMLKVARLSARYEILPLFEGRFSINSVQLFGFAFQLNREDPEAVPNYQFLLDALAPKDTLKEETNLDLRINSVLVRRGRIKYDVLSEPETPGKFNSSHIDVENLAATISLKALKKDSLNAAIKRLSFTEQSGFSLKNFLFKVSANDKLTSDVLIQEACTLLDKGYWTSGEAGAGHGVYGNIWEKKYDGKKVYCLSESEFKSFDCTGFIYYILTKKLDCTTSGFYYQNPVPVDPNHWYTDAKGKTVTQQSALTINYNGNSTAIKVLKAGENITENNRYYNTANGNLPVGSIVVSHGKKLGGHDHAWIYLGDLKTTDAKEVAKDFEKITYINFP